MTEHFAQGKFRRGLKCKQDLVLSHLRGVLYLHVPFRIESEFKNREFKQRYARQPEVDFFAILGRDFDQMFGQIDSVREKIRRNTNLLASRHIKREKVSLPVDMRRSKTSLLKLPHFSRNVTLFWNKLATGAALLVHCQSPPSISDLNNWLLNRGLAVLADYYK